MLNGLLNRSAKIAVLAGAGISLDSPSNLLDGWNFMFEALRRAAPADVDAMLRYPAAKLKEAETWRKSWVLSILDLPATKYRRPGERLRFEVLMAELVQSGLDPGLSILNCLGRCDRPNRNHYLLAQMIRAGHIVITTNFDRLIEVAYQNIAADDTPALRVAYEDMDFPEGGPSTHERPTLWKIHGSMSVDGADTRHPVQATMMSILTTRMTSRKSAFLKRVLEDFDLVVIGYSGWDDLDIIPSLANTKSSQRLIWVDHKNVPSPAVEDGSKFLAEAQWEVDVVARDRIFFTQDPKRNSIRDPKNILLVSTPTAAMMDAIEQVYLENLSVVPPADDFIFGSKYPDATQQYFDNWRTGLRHDPSAPYRFLSGLFDNLVNARKDIRQHIDGVHRLIDRIESSASATPAEKLRYLINSFNRLDPDDRRSLEQLQQKLLALIPILPPMLQGTGNRLLACILWDLEDPGVGAAAFQKAVLIDRAAGNEQEEFSTLTTWRQFAGYNQWSDLLAEDVNDDLRELISESYIQELQNDMMKLGVYAGMQPFPEEETRRLYELAGRIGFFPRLWNQALLSLRDVIDDDPQVLTILNNRVQKIKRFAVDLGDVLGEAQATLVSGRIMIIDEQFQIAIEEFLRVQELERITGDENLSSEAAWLLHQCVLQTGTEYMNLIKPFLQKSMWGKGN